MPIHLVIRSAAALALLASAPAFAAKDCDNALRQGAMNQCPADAYKREDVRLNTLYKQLVGLSDKAEAARLKQIQLAWIRFRDLHCRYEKSRYEGGSMAPLVYFNCLRDLTRQRNDTLQALIKDFH